MIRFKFYYVFDIFGDETGGLGTIICKFYVEKKKGFCKLISTVACHGLIGDLLLNQKIVHTFGVVKCHVSIFFVIKESKMVKISRR